jgi:hypothetical protein
VALSGHAQVPAEAGCAVAVSLSPVHTLRHLGVCAPMVHPLSHQVAMPATSVTIGRQVVTRDSGKEDAHSTSGVQMNMSDANVSHEHHRGQELSSKYESLVSSLSSSTEEPLTPVLQLEIAKQLYVASPWQKKRGCSQLASSPSLKSWRIGSPAWRLP